MTDLALRGVTKRFGATTVLRDVTLDVPSGVSVAILGPSGCGKTTLLRCLAGLEEIVAGTISMGGRVVAEPDLHVPPEDRDLAMVFQSYALWPHMDVSGNVGYPLRVAGTADAGVRTQAALRAVRMDAFGTRRPAELSGGQQQRTALARALVAEPGLILMDEPLANLDMHLREEMRAEFRRLHGATGATMLTVTHDQADALSLADLVVVMEAGRVAQAADPQEIYARPANRAVAALVGRSAIVAVTDGRWRERPVPGAEGHDGEVVIRPEDVVVTDGDGVRVAGRIYLGDRWLLTLDDGDRFEAYLPRAAEIGDRVDVRVTRGWPLRDPG
ncbi:MAG: ABC transporter ATP-binding protein [Pseudomonadota bacterium]